MLDAQLEAELDSSVAVDRRALAINALLSTHKLQIMVNPASAGSHIYKAAAADTARCAGERGGPGGGGGLLYWARSCCSCCCCCCCCCLQRHTDRCAAPLVRCSDAARFKGLAAEDMLVYQCIQSAGSMGAGRGWWGAGRGAGGCSPAAAARLAGWIACVTLPAQAVRRALAGCLPACLAASADAAAAGVPCPPPRTAAEELLQASGRGT